VTFSVLPLARVFPHVQRSCGGLYAVEYLVPLLMRRALRQLWPLGRLPEARYAPPVINTSAVDNVRALLGHRRAHAAAARWPLGEAVMRIYSNVSSLHSCYPISQPFAEDLCGCEIGDRIIRDSMIYLEMFTLVFLPKITTSFHNLVATAQTSSRTHYQNHSKK